jgi:hypothetical protein
MGEVEARVLLLVARAQRWTSARAADRGADFGRFDAVITFPAT